MLLRVLGGGGDPGPADIYQAEFLPGDMFLLCTDGLTEMVDEDAIEAALARSVSAEAACRNLIDLALERGGEDNVTVALARYRFPDRA